MSAACTIVSLVDDCQLILETLTDSAAVMPWLDGTADNWKQIRLEFPTSSLVFNRLVK